MTHKIKPNNWKLNPFSFQLLAASPVAVLHNAAPQPVWPLANQRLAAAASLYDSGSPSGGETAATLLQMSGPRPSQLHWIWLVLPQVRVASTDSRMLQTILSEDQHCRFSAFPFLFGDGKNELNRCALVTNGKEIIALFSAALFTCTMCWSSDVGQFCMRSKTWSTSGCLYLLDCSLSLWIKKVFCTETKNNPVEKVIE